MFCAKRELSMACSETRSCSCDPVYSQLKGRRTKLLSFYSYEYAGSGVSADEDGHENSDFQSEQKMQFQNGGLFSRAVLAKIQPKPSVRTWELINL